MIAAPLPPDESVRLASLQALDVLDSPPEQEFDALTRVASLVCGTPVALISLVDADRLWFKANVGLPEASEIPRSIAFCPHVILGDKVIEVRDATCDERFHDNPFVTGPPDIRFYAGAPLKLSDGAQVGTLCVVDYQVRELDPQQLDALRELAAAVSMALEGRRAVHERERLLLARVRVGALIEHSVDAIVGIDRLGCITDWNAAAAQMFGYTDAEVHGRRVNEVLGSDLQDAWPYQLDRVEASGQGLIYEAERRCKDSTLLPVSINLAPLLNSKGQVVGATKIVRDMRPQRAALEALEQSEARFSVLSDSSPLGVYATDLSGRCTYTNERWQQIFGQQGSESLGEGWARTLSDGDRDLVFAAWSEAAHSGRDFDMEFCVSPPGCVSRVVRARTRPVRDVDGRLVSFVGCVEDITERRRADDATAEAHALLNGSIDALEDAFVLFDTQDRLLICNDAYRRLYQMPPEVLAVGASYEEILRHGLSCGLYEDAVGREENWLCEQLVLRQEPSVTKTQRLSNGRMLRVRDQRMSSGYIVGIRTEVTDLVRAREKAEDAARAKGLFLANMSHEIRTPMNAVLGMLSLLRSTALLPNQEDYVARAEEAASSLMGLLNDILDFTKIDAGKLELELRSFRLDTVLGEIGHLLGSGAAAKSVEFVFDVDSSVPRTLVGDAMRLRQVLTNLVGNAIKFTDDGEVVVAVRLLERRGERATVLFSVRDTGIGIAKTDRTCLFNAFTQAQASITRRFGDTGLGLAISARLVQAMGGQLTVDSEVGVGSAFSFTANFQDGAPTEQTSDQPSPGRLLIAVDHPLALQAVATMARAQGWEVDVASSAHQALDLAHEAFANTHSEYEAVIAEWDMPGKDGETLGTAIRALVPVGRAPVLALMGSDDEQVLGSLGRQRVQPDGILVKPITGDLLAEALINARASLATPSTTQHGLKQDSKVRLQDMRILVVEDNANNQFVARELLEREGAHVTVAEHGLDAVNRLSMRETASYDVVLMDLQMPVMDGLMATRRIRQQLGLTMLPIIAMTANAMVSDRDACIEAGMNDHLSKPFDMDQLVRLLYTHTGRPEMSPADSQMHPGSNVEADAESTLEHIAVAAGVVDLSGALRRMGQQTDLYAALLSRVLRDLHELPNQLRECIVRGDSRQGSRLLHGLKGLAGTLGAEALSQEVGLAEKALSAGPAGHEAAQIAERAIACMVEATAPLTQLIAAFEQDNPIPTYSTPSVLDAETQLRSLRCFLAQGDLQALQIVQVLGSMPAFSSHPYWPTLEKAMAGLDFPEALKRLDTLDTVLVHRGADSCVQGPDIMQDNPSHWDADSNAVVRLERKPRVLVVDDEPINIQMLNQAFSADHQVFMAASGLAAIEACVRQQPDIVLLDLVMPGIDGYEVCRRLKQEAATSSIPVIFTTAHNDAAAETLGLDVGAVDFISKPINPRVVRARVKTHLTLKLQSDMLRRQAYVDGLTGLSNRRHFDEFLAEEQRRSRREGDWLALLLVDVDHFKLYNDRYGHPAGDDCLRHVAAVLRKCINRGGDLLARYGGEEFACVLPGTDAAGALRVAHRMVKLTHSLGIPHEASSVAPVVTVSVGVGALCGDTDQDIKALIDAADERLYAAKGSGRNRAVGPKATA